MQCKCWALDVSQGTRCKQFLFSLSLNPPKTESAPISVFENAIDDIEKKLGLADQSRAIIFHEMEAVVTPMWSGPGSTPKP